MRAHDRLAGSDPVLGALIERLGPLSLATRLRRGPRLDALGMLIRSVVAQQVSARAAETIHGRVLDLFGGRTPTAAELLALDPVELRGAGLSGRKVSYLRDLAARVEAGELEPEGLAELSDAEVVERIVAVRGFGIWSAQMFLIFSLRRPDVLPTGDLGIRRAVQVEYGLAELPGPDELAAIAEPWRPRRTLACVYLWESLHGAPA